jgi:hypothetical protein
MFIRICPGDAILLAGLSAAAAADRVTMHHVQLMVTNTVKFRLDDEV